MQCTGLRSSGTEYWTLVLRYIVLESGPQVQSTVLIRPSGAEHGLRFQAQITGLRFSGTADLTQLPRYTDIGRFAT